jgi:hypothetical protein
MIAEKAAVYETRKGLEGCEAAPVHSAGAGAERSPGKPGFRRLRRKCAQITGKIFVNVKLLKPRTPRARV